MWRYRGLLPVPDGPVHYPLPVGGTPLLPAPALRQTVGRRACGSRTRRAPDGVQQGPATALVIEDGLRRGVGTITTASTGNAAVATAFGAAAAGMRAVIFVSADCQPEKLALMTQAGARVFQVDEGYAAAVDLSRAAARTFGWLDRNTGANPFTLEAKKTVAFEVWEQLGRRIPDVMIVPVGDGPTLVALDKGFAELVSCGLAARQPRLVGVQAERCQPLVRAWLGAPPGPAELDPAATVADGIAVAAPGDRRRRAGRGARAAEGWWRSPTTPCWARWRSLAAVRAWAPSPRGQRPWPDWRVAVERGMVDRLETVVVLVTGREVKAAGGAERSGPTGPGPRALTRSSAFWQPVTDPAPAPVAGRTAAARSPSDDCQEPGVVATAADDVVPPVVPARTAPSCPTAPGARSGPCRRSRRARSHRPSPVPPCGSTSAGTRPVDPRRHAPAPAPPARARAPRPR